MVGCNRSSKYRHLSIVARLLAVYFDTYNNAFPRCCCVIAPEGSGAVKWFAEK